MFLSEIELEDLINKKIQGAYFWMSIGLIITFGIMFYSLFNPILANIAFSFYASKLSLIILLAVVFLLSYLIRNLSGSALKVLFISYSVFIGIVFIPYAYFYALESILLSLVGTGAMFIGLTLYGYFTKENLQGFTKYLVGALFGIIAISLLNTFLFKSNSVDLMISFIGLAIFMVYTAVDTQRIKNSIMQAYYEGDEKIIEKIQIIGALNLYLDFINMFIYLLSLFGKRKN